MIPVPKKHRSGYYKKSALVTRLKTSQKLDDQQKNKYSSAKSHQRGEDQSALLNDALLAKQAKAPEAKYIASHISKDFFSGGHRIE